MGRDWKSSEIIVWEGNPMGRQTLTDEARFQRAQRRQIMMQMLSLDQMLAEDHTARLIWADVEAAGASESGSKTGNRDRKQQAEAGETERCEGEKLRKVAMRLNPARKSPQAEQVHTLTADPTLLVSLVAANTIHDGCGRK